MSFASFSFIVFVLISIVLLRVIPPGLGKSAVLAAANLLFLASFVSNPVEAVPLLVFVLLGYGAIHIAECLSGRRGISLVVTGLVAGFVWIKQYSIVSALPALDFWYLKIGLSFILFRILHLVIDVSQEMIRRPTLLEYLNYTLFFLAFVSGPIQRYEDFAKNHKVSRRLSPINTDGAVRRAALGFLFLFVLAPPLLGISTNYQAAFYKDLASGVSLNTVSNFGAAAFSYLIYLYMNFGGYMHIVIGVSRLAGYDLPENFNAPWRTANFLDLWSRWHITFSEWLKVYVFNPLVTWLAERCGTVVSMTTIGAIGFFVTFGVMGIWHGSTLIYTVYGVLLGGGVTVNRLWQAEAARRCGRDWYRTLCRRTWYQWACRAAALAYFALALTCLWIDPAQMRAVSFLAVVACGAGAYGLITAGLFALCALESLMTPLFRNIWGRLAAPATRLSGSSWTAVLVFVMTLTLIVAKTLRSGTADVIVYAGF